MPKNKAINLLPQEEFDTSILGRVLKWAMGTFRIIVIITEMVVMGAFLSRFWLDAQNSDLTEVLKIKTAQIESQADFEAQFRSIQKKLTIAKQIRQNPKPSTKMDMITSKVPGSVFLTSITVQDTLAQLKGTASSEAGVSQFLANLQSEKSFKNVELGQVNSGEDNSGQVLFNIKISH